MERVVQRRDSDAGVVKLTPARSRTTGWSLSVGGICQSWVDTEDPAYMHLRYLDTLARAVDGAAPDGPLRALHIGGGAFALPRRLAELRTGSVQTVVEPNSEMIELVLEVAPLRPGAEIHFLREYGEAAIQRVRRASLDLIVVDAYNEDQMPPALTGLFFADHAARALADGGVVAYNVIEIEGAVRSRAIARQLSAVFPSVAIIGGRSMMGGRAAHGNVAVVAKRGELSESALVAAATSGSVVELQSPTR